MVTQAVAVPVEDGDEEFGERVFKARLSGMSERAVAKRFGITTKEVRAICLPRVPSIDNESRGHELQLDLSRIGAMSAKFYDWVMDDSAEPATACAAASIFIRLSERRAALLGLDQAPVRQVATITFAEPQPRETSTDKILKALEFVASQGRGAIDGAAS